MTTSFASATARRPFIKRSDTYPDLVLDLFDENGPVDLSSATGVHVLAVRGQSLVINREGVGTSNGTVTVPLEPGDTAVSGALGIEVKVSWPSGTLEDPTHDGLYFVGDLVENPTGSGLYHPAGLDEDPDGSGLYRLSSPNNVKQQTFPNRGRVWVRVTNDIPNDVSSLVEDPDNDGLYLLLAEMTENPPGSGLYTVGPLTENPTGSGLYGLTYTPGG